MYQTILSFLTDWPAMTAIAAIVSVWVLFYQTRQQQKFEAYWQLYKQWDSSEMRASRRRAAALLAKKEFVKNPDILTVDINAILDFFDTLAMLVHRRIIDKKLAWHQFYWWAVNYWFACEEYVREAQAEEGAKTWEDIQSIIPKLMKREGEPQPPTQKRLADFLAEEKALPT